MPKFACNNAKNISTSHTDFKLNCGYYLRIFFEKDIDYCLKTHSAKKLDKKLKDLMSIYQQNLLYAQKLEKQAHYKNVKPRSYVSGKKIWLECKCIKTKWHCIFKNIFFDPFQVLHSVGKQAYKLELLAK